MMQVDSEGREVYICIVQYHTIIHEFQSVFAFFLAILEGVRRALGTTGDGVGYYRTKR